MVIALATTSSYFALAAAGHNPPVWMWAVLIVANAGSLLLQHRNRATR